nr:glycosyltransferase [Zobellia laminariae]
MKLEKQTQNTKPHIVFMGEIRFPYGLAAVQRLTLMAKAFIHEGCRVTVICRKGSWNQDEHKDFEYKGNFEGIDYIYTSKDVHRPKSFFGRNVQKIKGIIGELRYLRELKKHDRIDLAIVPNREVKHALRYLLFSYFYKIPTATNFVEMASSMEHRTGFLQRINDRLIDSWVLKKYNGALPISDRLMNHYNQKSPSKPALKLPILCDFEKFNIPRGNQEEPYFLYCGSIRYKEVFNFVIEAYKSLNVDEHTKLYMIVSGGSKKETAQLEDEINSSFTTQPIKLYTNIPYEKLVYLYTNAIALLIPLRPTIQDTSRFPHKIGEYLASGNPVVTTAVGEIMNYFEDGKTALVANKYDVTSFAQKMRYVIDNPEKSVEIGLNGKELGLREFDYRAHGKKMLDFLKTL